MRYLILSEGLKKGHIIRCSENLREIYVWGLNKYVPLDSETEWNYFYHGDGDLVGEYVEISEDEANEWIVKNGKDVEKMLIRAKKLAHELNVQLPDLPEDNFEAVIAIVCECLQNSLCTDFVMDGLFSRRVIHAAKVRYNKKYNQ